MDKLSIEEKAKRYDEAIKKAKSKIKDDKDHVLYEDDVIEIFPELKESEDERIRKEIIDFVKSRGGFKGEWIAWLEKQSNDTKYLAGFDAGREVQKIFDEQKPTWSEEDEKIKAAILAYIKYENEHNGFLGQAGVSPGEMQHWLKSLKDRVQPKKEWSEDTQQWIDAIIKDYEGWYDADIDHRATIQAKINILKSLRPQSHWKPSDEQMEALLYEVNAWDEDSVNGQNLKSLYQGLKKLIK